MSGALQMRVNEKRADENCASSSIPSLLLLFYNLSKSSLGRYYKIRNLKFSTTFNHNPTFTISSNTIQPVSSARNLGIIFDSNLSFSDHISYISKSCFSHIRDLRRIRNTLDHKTACTIATSLIHSKLDYCNSLFLNISNQQLNRLQLVLNSAARAVTKTPKFHHITPHLKSLHWLKITQRIQYKILSLTYKSLQYN